MWGGDVGVVRGCNCRWDWYAHGDGDGVAMQVWGGVRMWEWFGDAIVGGM